MKNFVFVRMKNASFYLVHCCWHEFQSFGRSNHLWAYNHVDASCMMMSSDKVPEYPFKQNKNMLNNMEVLLCTYFYNASLNVLRPTFFNTYNLPFSCSPNIRELRINFGPKTNYFSCFMSSCTNRIAVFYNFLHWYVANQETKSYLQFSSFEIFFE